MISNDTSHAPLARVPLYHQLAERLRVALKDRCSDDRLPTEAEYAKIFAVSIFTVRQALLVLEREGLVERRQGSGTFVREKPIPPRHVAVLLDVDVTSENLSPYFLKITREICKALKRLGLPSRAYLGDLPLGTEATGLTCQDLLDDVRMERISGLISFFTNRAPEWTDLLKTKNIPVIDPAYFRLDHRNDDREQEFLRGAFQYFVERDRKHIALLAWESTTDGSYFFSKSFMKLAGEYGVRVDTHLMDINASGWERGMGWERFRDMWRANEVKPDGLIIGDDGLFDDCQRAILELGISVPGEMDVIVQSSDAVALSPQFPIYLWKLLTKGQGEIYAREMQALLEGRPAPAFVSWPHVVDLSEFSAMEEPSLQTGSVPH